MSVGKIILMVLGILLLIIVILLNIPVRVRAGYIGKKIIFELEWFFLRLFPKKEKEEPEKDEGSAETPEEDIDGFADEKDEKEEPPPEPEDEKAEEKPSEKPDEKAEEPPETRPSDEKTEEKAEEKEEKAEKPPDKKDRKKKEEDKGHIADRIIALAEDLAAKKDAVILILDLIMKDTVRFVKKVYFTDLYIDFEIANEDSAKAAVTYGGVSAAVYNIIGTLKSLTRCDVRTVDMVCLYNSPDFRYDGEITLRLRPASFVNFIFALLFKFLFHLKKYRPILDAFLKK
ncbi:MAG: hypothetical protein J6F31_06495 [Oscillospiraceae bacterium]|nr:hypothetical protein [Oscillospiraceae bacterium]